VFAGCLYTKRFLANAFPDPDLRYFSKLIALYLSENAPYVINANGLLGLV
jgi:hypothetical protein